MLEVGSTFTNTKKVVEVTRITAESGANDNQHRWVYFRNTSTNEKHCQRLDLFLDQFKFVSRT